MEVREPDVRYLTAVQRTELGELPADWQVVRLSDIATVTSGKRLPLGESLTTSETPHPYIRVSDMGRGTVDATAMRFVPVDVFPKIQQYRIFSTDLYISVAGTLGLVGQIPTALDGANLTENANRIAGIRGSKAYLYQVLASPLVQTVIESERTVGAQPKLALGRIRNFSIPLPPTSEEQVAIGSALTDADTLIDSLEQLLTKKRQIKQGAMQELLTGKRRLPGFQQSWSEIRLGDVGRTYGGLTGKGKADFGHGASKYITFMNVMTTVRTSTEMVERVEVGPSESQNMVQTGDLLFNGSSETPEEVALCSWVEACDEGVFLNSFCFGFRPFVADRLSGLFMAYFFRGRPGRAAVSSLAQGATRYNIAKTALLQAPLCLPTFVEQQAIAEVLSSMDTEIAALESRLIKARALKQTMAQALLTGRIRLVPEGAGS